MADPLSSSQPRLRLYLRVSEIVSETQDRSAKLALEAKPIHRVLPLKRGMFTVMDEPNYTRPLLVNPDFSRLTANRTIPNTHAGTVSFVDMECLEKCSRSLLEGSCHALWQMSGLLSHLKVDGSSPSDPSLFDKTISPISCMLASQTFLAVAMAEFMVTKLQEFLFSDVSLPLTTAQKQELLVSPGQNLSLFDQSLLKRVCGRVKEDSFISTSMAMAKPGGKAKASSSSASSSVAGGSSPLDFSQLALLGFASGQLLPVRVGAGLLLCLPERVFASRIRVLVP